MLRPDLSNAKRIAFDIETHDPKLGDMGPGVYRKDGKILGVSISDGVFAEYYNLGHYDCAPDERSANIAYLRDVLGTQIPKVGQHLVYDLDWLENGEHKIKVNGTVFDIEIAEALIDENQRGKYNLDAMAHKYLGEGKQKSEIDRFCAENGWKGDPRGWLWKMPYEVVRSYAIADANQPFRILDAQWPTLVKDELVELLELECELTRCLLHFRRTGVRIDVDKRDRNALAVQNRIETYQHKLFAEYGEFNAGSSQQVARLLDKIGHPYPRTENGNPNIDAVFYRRNKDKHPLIMDLFELRRCIHHLKTFLMGSYVRFVTDDGLIHCNFYNMETDDYGTRSGRLASAKPNLQQQPSKGVDEYWGQICREVYVPFEDCWWCKADYSQIEYRFLAHFAVGPGSEELRAAYNTTDVDYHQYIMDLTGLKRRYAKNLNFGVAFGMGAPHMADLFGWELEYALEILEIYHARAPYIRSTVSLVEDVARKRGYIKTFLKRRSHLIDRRKAYVMFCRLLQGSAADLMKAAMLACYKAGVFDVLHPHATVHDEIDVSVPKSKLGLEACAEMQDIMQKCLTIRVPIKAELEFGKTWADVHEVDWADLLKEIS